jgi:energy-converting hydrogenase Eha subunit C
MVSTNTLNKAIDIALLKIGYDHEVAKYGLYDLALWTIAKRIVEQVKQNGETL